MLMYAWYVFKSWPAPAGKVIGGTGILVEFVPDIWIVGGEEDEFWGGGEGVGGGGLTRRGVRIGEGEWSRSGLPSAAGGKVVCPSGAESDPGWWFGGSWTGSLPVPTSDFAISALMGRSRTIGADNEMAGPPGGPVGGPPGGPPAVTETL